MKRSTGLVLASALATALLTGCSGAGTESVGEARAESSQGASEGTHVMPDGTVMSDSEMKAHGSSDGPSEAARMICEGDVPADVSRILDLDSQPPMSSVWDAPDFSCTYDTPSGPLVLTVNDAESEEVGRAHFADLRGELSDVKEIKGVYSLGLPAYRSEDGTVVFIRDGKTLEVDATGLSGKLGVGGEMSQADIAYAVATSVLACWKAHT